jgi:hypothetical protein
MENTFKIFGRLHDFDQIEKKNHTIGVCTLYLYKQIVDANISLYCFLSVLKPFIFSSFNLSNSETEIAYLCF